MLDENKQVLKGWLYDWVREKKYPVEVQLTDTSVVIRYPNRYPTPREIHIYPDKEVDLMVADVDESYTYIDVAREGTQK